ncbi:MAG TPA: insulinase family protein, partial [Candidatus Krumholzibacteria bacterium]|nr:insulinase family protein [Candidatus Krumholzibacteria bacterium]
MRRRLSLASTPILVLFLSLLLHTPMARAIPLKAATLPDGLRIILIPRPGSGLIASNVFVGAGASREEDRYAGSSHFLEHLLFNGTTKRTQEEIYAFGDRIGAYNNATTRREYTHFMMVAPKEKLSQALDLQSDMLLHSILPPDKFEKERGIVIEEIAKDQDNPDDRISSALDSLLHRGDPPFQRPVLGTPATIAALPRAAVLEYYHRQYVPSNMRLILMGDFDPDDALTLIGKYFATTPGEEKTCIPAPVIDLRSEGPATVATAIVQAPAVTARATAVVDAKSPREHAMLALLVEVLGGGDQNRLSRALALEPAIEVESNSASLQWIGGKMMVQMEARFADPAALAGVFERMTSAWSSLDRQESAELEAARTRLLSTEISQLEQLHYYALFHGDRLWSMDENFLNSYLDALEDLSPEDLNTYVRKLFGGIGLAYCAAGPGVPQLKDASSLAAKAKFTGQLIALSEKLEGPPPRQLPPHLPADEAPRVTQLENGMTLIHSASTSTRMVALHLLVKNRSAREPADRHGIADVLHRLLPPGGDSPLQDRIGAELKVADNPWIPFDDYYTTPLYSFVRLSVTDEFYRDAIELLATMCSRSFEDEDELAEVRTQLTGVIGRQAKSSRSLSAARLDQLLFPDQPLADPVLPSMPVLQSITLKEINAFAPKYLAPEHLVLAIVGDVPYQTALEKICAAFHTRPTKEATSTDGFVQPESTGESNREVIEVGGAQSTIRMGRVVSVDPADRWALEVAVMVLSDRMQQDLRETRGLAYSLGVGIQFLGARAAITASMGTQPKNLEEAESAMRDYMI